MHGLGRPKASSSSAPPLSGSKAPRTERKLPSTAQAGWKPAEPSLVWPQARQVPKHPVQGSQTFPGWDDVQALTSSGGEALGLKEGHWCSLGRPSCCSSLFWVVAVAAAEAKLPGLKKIASVSYLGLCSAAPSSRLQ